MGRINSINIIPIPDDIRSNKINSERSNNSKLVLEDPFTFRKANSRLRIRMRVTSIVK